jgi:hypothetical protein
MRSMPADDDQRAILAALLREHPRMVGLPELLTLVDVERPDEAVHHLVADGVAVRLGDLVGVTRAAVRYSELTAH